MLSARNMMENGAECENVRIWLDNWIPNQLDFTKPHPQGLEPTTTMGELIDLDT